MSKEKKIGATVEQIQWILFFIMLVDSKFFIVWFLSLFFNNKYESEV